MASLRITLVRRLDVSPEPLLELETMLEKGMGMVDKDARFIETLHGNVEARWTSCP